MRTARLAMGIGATLVLLAGSARAGLSRGYPQTDAPSAWAVILCIATCKTVYLSWRYRTSPKWSALMMLTSTLIWSGFMWCVREVYFDIGEIPDLLAFVAIGFSLSVAFDWVYVCPVMPRSPRLALRSLKAALVMAGVLAVAVAGVLLWVHSGMPPILEDVGPE